MEFRQIQTFMQIAQVKNFSKTAELLGYSQSAVTVPVSYTHLDVYKRQKLVLEDNTPHGCIFSFTLPLSEVTLNE